MICMATLVAPRCCVTLAVAVQAVNLILLLMISVGAAAEDHIDALGGSNGIMCIKNTLPYDMTIVCTSNAESIAPFRAPPLTGSLQFNFNPKLVYEWLCELQSEGRDGSFVLWKSVAAGGPGKLCGDVCQWRAGLEGLWVERPGGNFALVYLWH